MELLSVIFWFLTFFVCSVFIIFGIDDLMYDITYWSTTLWMKIKGKVHMIVNGDRLETMMEIPEKKIAMLIPCWHEANVIGQMVRHNMSVLEYSNYDIFVGVYPNDVDTVNVVKELAKMYPRVHLAVNKMEGPTTKGNNLNSMMEYVLAYEKQHDVHYDMFVINDAEDVIHPKSLKLFNSYISDFDMIQLPVLPLSSKPWYNFNYWSYSDEFAENHNKDMVVRNRLHGMVPSAGTGMALSRQCIKAMVTEGKADLFDEVMFAEDYDLSYRIHLMGLKSVFLKQWIPVKDKATGLTHQELIGIQEYFPDSYSASVRQKSRWVFGIVFQESNKYHWHGKWMTKLTLIHDRKAVMTHFVNVMGYFILIYILIAKFFPQVGLIDFVETGSLLWYLLIITFVLMVHRLIERFIAVTKHYGFFQGFLSLFRFVFGNIINFHALIASMQMYSHHVGHKQEVKWHKTDHEYPIFHDKSKG